VRLEESPPNSHAAANANTNYNADVELARAPPAGDNEDSSEDSKMQLDSQPVPSTDFLLSDTLLGLSQSSVAGTQLQPPTDASVARPSSSNHAGGRQAAPRPAYHPPLTSQQQGLHAALFDPRRAREVQAIEPLTHVPPENWNAPAWVGQIFRLASAIAVLDNERIRLSRQVGTTLDSGEARVNRALQAVGSELGAVKEEFQNLFDENQDRVKTTQSQIDQLAKGLKANDKKIEKLEKDIKAAGEDAHKLTMRNSALLVEQQKVTDVNKRLARRLAETKQSNNLLRAAIQRAKDNSADVKIDDALAQEIQSDEQGLEIDRNEAEELAIPMSSITTADVVAKRQRLLPTHGSSDVEYHLLVLAWKGENDGWKYVLEEDLEASDFAAHTNVIFHLQRMLKGKVAQLSRDFSIIFQCNRRDIGDYRFYWKGNREDKLVETWTRQLVVQGRTSEKAWMKAFVFPSAKKVELLEKMIEDDEDRAGAAVHQI
jgi:uncharacterized phage infection (PIP) family protein YhgE